MKFLKTHTGAMVVLAVVIVAVLIRYFKRKKWF